MGGPGTCPHHGADRGAGTRYPWRIPLRVWLDIAWRIGRETFRDHVFIASSGVAFLALFALLPTLIALVSAYGLVTSPEQLSRQMQLVSSMAPHNVVTVLHNGMHAVVHASRLKLGFSIVLSIIAAVWVSVRAVLGIISALNIVYDEKERRGWSALFGTAIALALGALVFWVLALAMIVGAPLLIGRISVDSTVVQVLIGVARWLVIAATALVSMTVLYRFGPSHAQPRWRWLSVGSFVGTALWLAGSACMSAFIEHMGQFSNVYGPLGMVMVVMTWFFLTAFVFLLGAELNVEVERHVAAGGSD
ncbi:MAG TPA: YihY/virulence factor BrkB family protein [Oleiagrimonas sp.]|nr:YihY/virulence factor BrkB family protein [Oleiagrimonas sp.]